MTHPDFIDVQLERPFAIGPRPCNALATWFVAALAERALQAGSPASLPADALRRRIGNEAAYPMAVTRLFRLCEAAGVQIGWGPGGPAAPTGLSLHGRKHGPFWVAPGQARRLRFWLGERRLRLPALRQHLLAACADPETAAGTPAPTGDGRFWFSFLQARQQAEEGGSVPPAAALPSLSGLAALAQGPGADLQQAWALFALARQARRRDATGSAREALQRALAATEAQARQPRREAVRGLCHLGLAWCAYQDRRYGEAQALLDRGLKPAEGAVWQHNPRLRAERLNLQALLLKSRLSRPAGKPVATADAARVIAGFEEALVCAIEADSFTLVESIASNLGYAIWLLQLGAAGDAPDGEAQRVDAIRWLLLSEWYRRRHALAAGSLSNLLSVCRIARGGLPYAAPSATGTTTPLKLATLRQQLGPFGELLGVPPGSDDWSLVTSALLDEVRAQPEAHGRLETAGVMLEHLWQLCRRAHAAAGGVAPLLTELRCLVAAMNAVDRGFFAQELRSLEASGLS
ncbi:hypothetical protein OOT46_04570 [Aquabacterium sp. A7-Y]|uniref:hypothetical protein n=1 Tax=Aquabacterium sp. A7-Y TaxID=1349605 RepID=UPI00223E04A3|nr:hypothetical protein [Aquabacterium sp. A7-Y]MCW7537126.1 hypothetical protein [Aquabacterium sp. A7-Y]